MEQFTETHYPIISASFLRIYERYIPNGRLGKKTTYAGKTAASQHLKGLLYLFRRSHGNSFMNGYPEKKNWSNMELISQHVETVLESTDKIGKTAYHWCTRIFFVMFS